MYHHIRKRHCKLTDEQKEENLKNGIRLIKDCSYCGIRIRNSFGFSAHVKACKFIHECEFLKKFPNGYHCSICDSYYVKASIHVHMKNKHTDYYLDKYSEDLNLLKFERESP